MTAYLVTWDAEVDADSPAEAAQLARDMQLDPHSTATVFEVRGEDETEVVIDLDDTGNVEMED